MDWLERLRELMEEENGGEGGGAGGDGPEGPELQLRNKLAQYGNDAFALARDLYTDNYKVRDRARKAEARIKDLQSKVPGEGAIVLTGDDAKLFTQFKELGKTPEEVKTAIDREGEFYTLKRQQTQQKAARLMEWNEAALVDLLGDREVTVTGDGKDAKVQVTVAEGENKPLKEWVESEKAHFLPSLTAGTRDEVHFGAGGKGSQSESDLVGDWLKKRNEAESSSKNPLDG